MKRSALAGICISSVFMVLSANGQNCKPDYSKVDKIEKKKIEAWSYELYETSFGTQMFSTSQVYITFIIGKMDDAPFVELQLQKKEESLENQLTSSSLRGAKGNEFFFGTKNGDPLKFVTTEATNETKTNSFSGKIVTTVHLLSEIKPEDLAELKTALTTRTIDALRIKLENNLVLNQDVKGKKGDKMREKAICFFNSQPQTGSLKTVTPTETKSTKPEVNDNTSSKVEKSRAKGGNNQGNKPIAEKPNEVIVTTNERSTNSEQFEGVWTSETKKRVTITIKKIDAKNYEVKEIYKAGPLKKNISHCPTFEFANGELICKQYKIIYLPEKSSIYYDGNEFRKE